MKIVLTLISILIFFNPLYLIAQELDSVSYSLGILIAKNLKQQGFEELNPQIMVTAIEDMLAERDLRVDMQMANTIIQAESTRLQEAKYNEIKVSGEEYLAKNAVKEGVVVLSNGLQYEILVQGEGEKPKITDQVTTHYHGTLISGGVFDSSVEKGTPATFPLNGVIKGWQEILQLMPVGSKWKVYIPQELAYGSQGVGSIPPYSALIFEIELLSIN